ncbi:MAG: serine/threonine protein kinase [Myxococcales bacterium]|nr:serine/threonine protein kinase [Myxococcales bacterium]
MIPEYDFSGRTLEGRYALVKKIGAGSFASVYLAQDLRMFGRKVAVKVLHPERGDSPAEVERFVQEMKVAARLDGPYRDRVVRIIDHGRCEAEAPALLFFVMEHVDGVTLQAMVTSVVDGQRRRRPLPWPQAVAVIQELVKALATLHACGVVHRDIKPGNCIIEQKPDGDFLKLLDLGIVKVLPGHEISADGPRTHPEFVLGTPRYMAPEQFAGPSNDPRVDLYAAGVMLYEFLTGDVPSRWYERPGAQHPYVAIPPSQANPAANVPPGLDAVALKAVAFEPGKRYQSADEFALALAEILLAAERQQARTRALIEESESQARERAGWRAAFRVGDLDARGWATLRWWVMVAMTAVAMRFAVVFATVIRRGDAEHAQRQAAASRALAQIEADKARTSARSGGKPVVARRTAPVVPPVDAPRSTSTPTRPASPPEPPGPVAEPRPPVPEPPGEPEPRPAPRTEPEPPPKPRTRPRPKDDAPPIWPLTIAAVEAEAERKLRTRCRGLHGKASVTVAIDVVEARVRGTTVAAAADPRIAACIVKHAAGAFQFAGLTRRVPQYDFSIDL